MWRGDVPRDEPGEAVVVRGAARGPFRDRRAVLEVGQGEIGGDARDLGRGQGERLVGARGELRFDGVADRLKPLFVHEDLDAGLVLVVAAAFEIVDAENGVRVGEEIGLRQEVADAVRDQRRAALAAADEHREPDLARRIAHDLIADVVDLDRRAVVRGAGQRDLELARQERIFRMER